MREIKFLSQEVLFHLIVIYQRQSVARIAVFFSGGGGRMRKESILGHKNISSFCLEFCLDSQQTDNEPHALFASQTAVILLLVFFLLLLEFSIPCRGLRLDEFFCLNLSLKKGYHSFFCPSSQKCFRAYLQCLVPGCNFGTMV